MVNNISPIDFVLLTIQNNKFISFKNTTIKPIQDDRATDVTQQIYIIKHKEGRTTTSKTLIHCSPHILLFCSEKFGKKNKRSWMNTHTRNWQVGLGPGNRWSMRSYILTHPRLRKREPMIALGSHQGVGGNLNFCICSTLTWDEKGREQKWRSRFWRSRQADYWS